MFVGVCIFNVWSKTTLFPVLSWNAKSLDTLERLFGVWSICPAGANMGMGVRQEGTQPSEGVSRVGLSRPHQELELNLEGRGGPLQDFQQKVTCLNALEIFFWLW